MHDWERNATGMGIFGPKKLDADERGRAVSYLKELFYLCAVQERAADSYNLALTHAGASIANPQVLQQVLPVARNLRDKALAIEQRHEAVSPVCESAASTYLLWHLVWRDYRGWTAAQFEAFQASGDGVAPNASYVQHLFRLAETSRQKAEAEQGKLMRLVGLSGADWTKALQEALARAASESGLMA